MKNKLFRFLSLLLIFFALLSYFLVGNSYAQDPPPWVPITGNEHNHIALGSLYRNGILDTQGNIWVGTFGPDAPFPDDCRSVGMVGNPDWNLQPGQYYSTIRGNTNGDIISFYVWDGNNGLIYQAEETLVYQQDGTSLSFDLHYYACSVSTPNVPSGPASGQVGTSYSYTAGGSGCSTQGHSVQYRFQWGDGTSSTWSSSANAEKTWASAGTYLVQAQARCATSYTTSGLSSSPSVTITTSGQQIPDEPVNPVYHILTINITGNGSTNISEGIHYYEDNTTLTLTAQPDTGWSFQRWVINGDNIYTSNPLVVMNKNITATVFFVSNQPEEYHLDPESPTTALDDEKSSSDGTNNEDSNLLGINIDPESPQTNPALPATGGISLIIIYSLLIGLIAILTSKAINKKRVERFMLDSSVGKANRWKH